MTTGEASDRVLQELLDYHAPLATVRHDYPGGTVLCTPGSPVLGLNAVYAATDTAQREGTRWQCAHGRPELVLSTARPAGGWEAARLMVGTFAQPDSENGGPADVWVEQVSRLQSRLVGAVLSRTWGASEWEAEIGLWLGRALETGRGYHLLVAYRQDCSVATGMIGGSGGMHLLGFDDSDALLALVKVAAAMDTLACSCLRLSATADAALPLNDVSRVSYWLMNETD